MKLWYYWIFFLFYVYFIIFILYKINFINFENSKDILYWIFYALVLGASISTYQKTVKKVIVELLSFSLIIEYILNFYIFPLAIEFIIVPLAFFIVVVYYLNNKDSVEKNQNGAIITNKICIFILLVIIVIQIIFAIIEINKELDIQFIILNIKNIFIPVILTILYTPFLIFFRFFGNYQKKLIRKRFVKKNNLD